MMAFALLWVGPSYAEGCSTAAMCTSSGSFVQVRVQRGSQHPLVCAPLVLAGHDASACAAVLPGHTCLVTCKAGFQGEPVQFMCLHQLAQAGLPPVGLRAPLCYPAGKSGFTDGEHTPLWRADGQACLRCDLVHAQCDYAAAAAVCTTFEVDLTNARVKKAGTDQCLDLYSSGLPGLWDCHGGLNQRFRAEGPALIVERGALSVLKQGAPSRIGFLPSYAALSPAAAALKRNDSSSFLRSILPLQMCKARLEAGVSDEFWEWLLQQEPGMLKALFSSYPVVPGQVRMLQDVREAVTPSKFEALGMHSFAVALSFNNRWKTIDEVAQHPHPYVEPEPYLSKDLPRIRNETMAGQHGYIESRRCSDLHKCCGHYSAWNFKWPQDPSPSIREFARWWVQQVEVHGSDLWWNPFNGTPWIFNVYLWPSPVAECEWVHEQLIVSPPLTEGSWYHYNSDFHQNICDRGSPQHHPNSLGGIAVYGGICGRLSMLETRRLSCMGIPGTQKAEPGHKAGLKFLPESGRWTHLSWSNTSACLRCPAKWESCEEVLASTGPCDGFRLDPITRMAHHVATGQCLDAHWGPRPGLWSCDGQAEARVRVIQPQAGCQEFAWSDQEATCGPCTVRPRRFGSLYGTCSSYCLTLGRDCVAGWVAPEGCSAGQRLSCDEAPPSGGAVCECSRDMSHGAVVFNETDRGVLVLRPSGGGPLPEVRTRWSVKDFHGIECPEHYCHFQSLMGLRSTPDRLFTRHHQDALYAAAEAFNDFETDGPWPIAHDEARLAATLGAALRDAGLEGRRGAEAHADAEAALLWAVGRSAGLYDAWEELADLAAHTGSAGTLVSLMQEHLGGGLGSEERYPMTADRLADELLNDESLNPHWMWFHSLAQRLISKLCTEFSSEEVGKLGSTKAVEFCKLARSEQDMLRNRVKELSQAADRASGNVPSESFEMEYVLWMRAAAQASKTGRSEHVASAVRSALQGISVGYVNRRSCDFYSENGRILLRGPYALVLQLAVAVLPRDELQALVDPAADVLRHPWQHLDRIWSPDGPALAHFLTGCVGGQRSPHPHAIAPHRSLAVGSVPITERQDDTGALPRGVLEQLRLDQDMRVELGSLASQDDGRLPEGWPGAADELLRSLLGLANQAVPSSQALQLLSHARVRGSLSVDGYERLTGVYLPGYAAGDGRTCSVAECQVRCSELGSQCAGFTCDSSEASCTVRAGPEPKASPVGEITYLREASPSVDGYERLLGSYLGGFAAGDSRSYAVAEAGARCEDLGGACAGFTCNAAETSCTVRAGSEPKQSPSGEISYLRKRAGTTTTTTMVTTSTSTTTTIGMPSTTTKSAGESGAGSVPGQPQSAEEVLQLCASELLQQLPAALFDGAQ